MNLSCYVLDFVYANASRAARKNKEHAQLTEFQLKILIQNQPVGYFHTDLLLLSRLRNYSLTVVKRIYKVQTALNELRNERYVLLLQLTNKKDNSCQKQTTNILYGLW